MPNPNCNEKAWDFGTQTKQNDNYINFDPSFSLVLPYPVTINHYYGFRGSQKFIKKKGKEYREEVERIVNEPLPFKTASFLGLISVSVTIFPPDKRKRDVDNVLKCLLDALQHAGVFENDNQISKLVVECKGHLEGYEVVKGGRVDVLIEEWMK